MLQTWRVARGIPRWMAWRPRSAKVAPVELCGLRYGFLPSRFRHRGELYLVAKVEQIWEEYGLGQAQARRHFRIACRHGGRCTLIQELQAGTWSVIW